MNTLREKLNELEEKQAKKEERIQRKLKKRIDEEELIQKSSHNWQVLQKTYQLAREIKVPWGLQHENGKVSGYIEIANERFEINKKSTQEKLIENIKIKERERAEQGEVEEEEYSEKVNILNSKKLPLWARILLPDLQSDSYQVISLVIAVTLILANVATLVIISDKIDLKNDVQAAIAISAGFLLGGITRKALSVRTSLALKLGLISMPEKIKVSPLNMPYCTVPALILSLINIYNLIKWIISTVEKA